MDFGVNYQELGLSDKSRSIINYITLFTVSCFSHLNNLHFLVHARNDGVCQYTDNVICFKRTGSNDSCFLKSCRRYGLQSNL